MLQPQNLIRLCLDLNIWCASLLSDRKGKQNSSSQSLVTIIREGYCEIGLVQLIISWGYARVVFQVWIILNRKIGKTNR
jgi:hypothetical protein